MTSAKILAIGGISSSIISMCAGGVAHFANLLVALRKDRT